MTTFLHEGSPEAYNFICESDVASLCILIKYKCSGFHENIAMRTELKA
jgi:hypothetical protein